MKRLAAVVAFLSLVLPMQDAQAQRRHFQGPEAREQAADFVIRAIHYQFAGYNAFGLVLTAIETDQATSATPIKYDQEHRVEIAVMPPLDIDGAKCARFQVAVVYHAVKPETRNQGEGIACIMPGDRVSIDLESTSIEVPDL
jgi:hypothetical protein